MEGYVKAENVETSEQRKAFCKELQNRIKQAKHHFNAPFQTMLEDMDMAFDGAVKDWGEDSYTVNVTQRYVRQKTASLYAKNPRATAKRKLRMNYTVWDGTAQSLQAAQEQLMMAAEAGLPPPPEASALLADVQNGQQQEQMLRRMGETLEICYNYYTNEQIPSFKAQMKQCVRSAVQTGVGYIKLGFQREMEISPDARAKIADTANRLAHIERLMADVKEGTDVTDVSAQREELELALNNLKQDQIIAREGLVFDFPSPTSIIPDPRCTSLKGWLGADWLAEELFMTKQEIKEVFQIDLSLDSGGEGGEYGSGVKMYSQSDQNHQMNPRNDVKTKDCDSLVCVWVMWDKLTGLKYTMAEGYKDFLEPPEQPDVVVERFFPVYAYAYGELTHPTRLFPPSDVRLMRDAQMELNRAKEAMREHRIANRPGYVVPRGSVSEDDKDLLAYHPPSAVFELDGLIPGQRLQDMMQALPKMGVDPNLYETSTTMQDIYMAVGYNESSLGTTSGATATETSIAESSRAGALEAEMDELNDVLTEIARDAGQVMLAELDIETVKDIAGDGAIWPQMSRIDIQKEVYLDIVAGSNGRPNKAQRQQSLQMLMPFLLQMPHLNVEWLGRLMVEAVDDTIDLNEAIAANMPSVMSMNNQAQVAQGPNDPNAQGAQGGNNAAMPVQGDGATPGVQSRQNMPV